MLEFILERGNYWAIIGLMMSGLYIAFAATNLIKRLIGLGLFQTSIILFYISLSRIDGGTAPILFGKDYKKDKGHGDGYAEGGEHAADHGGSAAAAAKSRNVAARSWTAIRASVDTPAAISGPATTGGT